MKSYYFKLIAILIAIIFIIEVIFSFFFPEYKGRSISKNNINKNNYYFYNLDNDIKIRDPKYKYPDNTKKIYILGDSITKGYGLAYQDIFFSVTEQLLNNSSQNSTRFQVIPFSLFNEQGSNLQSLLPKFKSYVSTNLNKENKLLIYQFNYNDILPSPSKKGISSKDFNHEYDDSKKNFLKRVIFWSGKFRYEYLNKSAFLTFLQIKISNILPSNSSKCTINSLGPYTFAYGTKGFEKKSEKAWKNFELLLKNLKDFSEKNNFILKVLVVPTILEFDNHFSSNPKNFNLNCSTIDANKKINSILKSTGINVVDPIKILKSMENKYFLERNEKNFFISLDHNHLNELGSRIVGEYLFTSISSDISDIYLYKK